MDYLLKVKNASLKVAAQGISLIQNVGQDIGLSVTTTADKGPVDDFIQRFQSMYLVFHNAFNMYCLRCFLNCIYNVPVICQIFDNLSKLESDGKVDPHVPTFPT